MVVLVSDVEAGLRNVTTNVKPPPQRHGLGRFRDPQRSWAAGDSDLDIGTAHQPSKALGTPVILTILEMAPLACPAR